MTADRAGTYTNGPSNITGAVGLDPPGIDAVEFTQADLELSKTADVAKASPGDTVTYTFTVTNHGPGGAQDVTVRDPLSPHLTWVGASPAGNGCDFNGGEVVCDFGSVPAGATVTKSFQAQLHPSHSAGEDPTAHLIDVIKVEQFWSLPAGAPPQDLTLACPAGYVATDGSARVDSVDQDASGQSRVDLVRVVASESVAGDASQWRVRAANGSGGQAQLHAFAVCVGTTTSTTAAHTHQLQAGSQNTSGPHAAPGGQRTEVDMSCPAGTVVVAPGFAFTPDTPSGTVFKSEPSNGGSDWTLGFDLPAGPGASVAVSWRCLDRQTTAGGAPPHSFALALYDVHENVVVPPSNLGSSQPFSEGRVTCPDGSKGIVGSWNLPPGVTVLGNTPQPINRDFRLLNLTGEPQNAELDLLCLKSRVGDNLNGGSVENEAYVSSAQPDWNWSNNLDSFVLEDPPAGPAPPASEMPGGLPAAPAGPAPADAAVPAPELATADPAATAPAAAAPATAAPAGVASPAPARVAAARRPKPGANRSAAAARTRCLRQARRIRGAKRRARATRRCNVRFRAAKRTR